MSRTRVVHASGHSGHQGAGICRYPLAGTRHGETSGIPRLSAGETGHPIPPGEGLYIVDGGTETRVHDVTQNQEDHTAARMRVVVADDDVLLREGLASLLERHDFAVVGQAGDAEDLMELVRSRAPDLVIVDIRMPPTHTNEGLEAAFAIRKDFPRVAILLLSA